MNVTGEWGEVGWGGVWRFGVGSGGVWWGAVSGGLPTAGDLNQGELRKIVFMHASYLSYTHVCIYK